MTVRNTWRLAMPMYNVSAVVAKAWEELLEAVIARLRERGWTDVMEIVRAPSDLLGFWQSPDVLLTQTCGYPFVTQLSDKVRLIATPAFALPGCSGPNYVSYFVVHENSDIHDLEALREKRAVINQAHSQSGMNALRHAIAPLAREGRFFSEVMVSGSHLNSLEYVRHGEADVASIDCVTFGLVQRFAPTWGEGIRVLGTSVPTPGLPLISAGSLTIEQVNDLRSVLIELESSVPELLRFLSLLHFEKVDQSAYSAIAHQITRAQFLGYPVLN